MKPCTHCGKCCSGSPCGLAERFRYVQKPGMPCPALRATGQGLDRKMMCGLVLDAATPDERKDLEVELKIGWGCHLWPQKVPLLTKPNNHHCEMYQEIKPADNPSPGEADCIGDGHYECGSCYYLEAQEDAIRGE